MPESESKYVVIELQTNSDGSLGNLVWKYDTRQEAESKYHSVLADAAVSKLPQHAAVLMTNEGFQLDSKCYYHSDLDMALVSGSQIPLLPS